MKKFIISLVAVLAVAFSANASNYTVNDEAIDALIENCTEVSAVAFNAEMPAPAPAAAIASPSPIGSFLLCTFVGGFGIHRHYMGTKKSMWALYTFTFGGIFGIVPTIDWVFLLIGIIDDDITPYLNNANFLMWV